MKYFILLVMCVCLSGCILSNTKIKVTDKLGNSLAISDEGLELDIKGLEYDSFCVDVMKDVDKEDNKE